MVQNDLCIGAIPLINVVTQHMLWMRPPLWTHPQYAHQPNKESNEHRIRSAECYEQFYVSYVSLM